MAGVSFGNFHFFGEDLKAVRYLVFRRDFWGGGVVVSDVDRFRNDDGFGLSINGSLAVIVLEGYTSAEAFFGVEVIRVAITGFIVDDNMVSKRDNRGDILVEGDAEVLPRLNLGIDIGPREKVGREISLIYQMVPHVVWEVGIYAGEDVEKVVLEGLDGPLSRIVTMVVQRDNLEVYFPVLFHDSPEFSAHLVVDYLKFYREAFGGESLHDGIVCGKIIFFVMTGKVGED